VFSDVWGHAQTSLSGHKYYVNFVDAYIHLIWLYLIKRKSDVFDIFIQFQKHVESILKHKIVHVQSDWSGEYRNLNSFRSLGIAHRLAYPHTHQQNGSIERKHRHIVEIRLTLLAHASVLFRFWNDVFTTACFFINCTPTRVLGMNTPIEFLLNEKHHYTFFKVFGCA
jgi:histone deacetylase 1/2